MSGHPGIRPELLGYDRTPKGWRPVWVLWLGDPHGTIAGQLPEQVVCGHCGATLSMAAAIARVDLANPAVRSFSRKCACDAALHFDTTAEAARADLQWIRRFSPTPGVTPDAGLVEPAEPMEQDG